MYILVKQQESLLFKYLAKLYELLMPLKLHASIVKTANSFWQRIFLS